jgi:hypothetical protein
MPAFRDRYSPERGRPRCLESGRVSSEKGVATIFLLWEMIL